MSSDLNMQLGREQNRMGLDNIMLQQERRSLALYIDPLRRVLRLPFTSAKGMIRIRQFCKQQALVTYRSDGGAASPSTVLGEGLLVGVGALGGVGNAVLGLPVLGQVEGGDLLGFLNLLLVRLDLALKLVNQPLHALMVLFVFLLRIGQLLDLALRFAEVLQAVSIASVLSIKVGLKLTDASVHSGHCLLSSLEGIGMGLINSSLKMND